MSDQTPPAKQAPPTPPLQVLLDDKTAMGDYVNMARIFHNQTEFVLDMMFLPPGVNTAKVLSRTIMSPLHAKHLLHALANNLQMYEQKFGEIVVAPPVGPGPILH